MSSAEEPHPEIRGLLDQIAALPAPASTDLSPEGARRFSKARAATPDEPEPVGDVMDLLVPGPEEQIPVRVYVPDGDPPYPALVYIHGGGWVLGDLDLYDPTCRALVNGSGCMVVSVDYRLAPEHRFPAALEDSYAAAEWVADHADALNVAPGKIAIGGDSAGGNLAAAVSQMARERDGPSFARQVLVYPVTDHSFDTDSYEENAEGYLLTRASMEWFWDQYLERELQGRNPYASPLRANDLSDLPPATVVTCGFDPLRDEGIAYAERLEEAGVPVTLRHYEDAIHGVIQFLVEPDLTRGRDVIADVSDDLRATME